MFKSSRMPPHIQGNQRQTECCGKCLWPILGNLNQLRGEERLLQQNNTPCRQTEISRDTIRFIKKKKKHVYEKGHEEWKRNEHNSMLFHMVPPVCCILSSFQEHIHRNKWGLLRRTFVKPPLCACSFYLSVVGNRGNKKGNAHHITSINYKKNNRPKRKGRYFLC